MEKHSASPQPDKSGSTNPQSPVSDTDASTKYAKTSASPVADPNSSTKYARTASPVADPSASTKYARGSGSPLTDPDASTNYARGGGGADSVEPSRQRFLLESAIEEALQSFASVVARTLPEASGERRAQLVHLLFERFGEEAVSINARIISVVDAGGE